MKTKFRHKVVAMTLAMMMTAAPVWGAAHAADEGIGEQPERPVAESYEDNDKIEDYNKKVDEYNKSAEEYNKSVDKEYEAAVEETNAKNAEIDQHNEAETERVRAAEERNAEAAKAAEEANTKIDEENEAEEARVNEHNSSEDAKAKASEDAKKAAEEENEAVKAHNEAVAKYAEDKAKYDEAKKQYEADLKMEQKILAAGYSSVQQYNDMINKNYNEPARASVEKNANANTVSAKDTYSVEEAKEKSGVTVNVHIEHVFEGTDVSYIEDFDIDGNDVITINSIAALGNATQPGYASLYYNTDDAHQMGYWVPYVRLEYNARYVNSTWNCGSTYEVSYKDGKNHRYDSEDIIAVYTYTWVPQKVYKTYNVPVAPTEPENPGEAKDMVEVPEIYTPEYQEFVKKDHVKAEIEKIEEANILERIASPVKKAYIALLSHMDLFAAPEKAEEAAPAVEAVAPAAPADADAQDEEIIPAAEIAMAAPAAEAAKSANAAPAAQTAQTAPAAEKLAAEETVTAMVDEQEVPMAGTAAEGHWALLNLIMAAVTSIISAILLLGYFNKKDDEEASDEEKKRRGFTGLAGLIAAISAVVIFIITEDMTLRMALTDGWTLLMAAILLIQAVIAVIANKSDEENEEEMTEAANA